MTPNFSAFLAVIRACEGTSGPNGYRTLFGGELFEGFADHPRIVVSKGGYKSTAAGAYQALMGTWDDFIRAEGPHDFSPSSQDLFARWCIKRRGALADVEAGRLREAIEKCNKEWASLPGSPYGQPTRDFAYCERIFQLNGGSELVARAPRPDVPVDTPLPSPSKPTEPRMPAPLIPIAISVLQGLLPQVLGLFSQRAQATITEKTGADPQLAAQFMQGLIQKVGDTAGVPVTDAATAQLAAAKLVVESKTPEGSEKVKALEADTLDYLHDLTVAMKDVVEIYGQEVKIETAAADAASNRANTGRASGEADMAAPLVYGALALIGALVVFTFGVAITQIVMLQTRSPTTEVWAAITGLIGFATGVVTTIYAYRFGTSKGSGAKDILIGEMARRDATKGA